MDYHLSWDGVSSILLVDLYYQSNNQDSLVFTYGNPTPGGLNTIFDIISNIKAQPESQLKISPANRSITVLNPGSGLHHLHYELDGKLVVDPKRARPNEAFRPTIAPGFLYTLGYNLYLSVNDESYTQMRVVWDHYPAKMAYFISCAPGAKANEPQIIPMDKRNSLLIQMNENLVVKKYKVNNIPNYLITSKSDTVNHNMQRQMKPFLNSLIPQMRNFWQDHDFDFYFVSMIPLLNQMPSTMTGIGLINGFGTRYSGPLDKEKTAVIAHEISHTWIGVRMQFKSVGMENEWFDEGFNDYIAIYSLVQSGMFDQGDFLHYINKEVLEQYYNNPVNTSPADSIAANFWKSKNFEKIPYHRGFIYAFYLDNQIRLQSGGKYSIKDFMQNLYQQCRQQKKQVIEAVDFAEAASGFLSKDQIMLEIKTNMLEGQLIDFRQVKLAEVFQVVYQGKIPVLKLIENVDLKRFYN